MKYVIVLPNNLTATGILLQYWLPNINVSVWIVVFGVIIIGINVRNSQTHFLRAGLTSPIAHPRQLLR